MIGRLLRLVVVFAVVAVIAAGGLLANVTLRALPQTSGTIDVEGLDDSVTVVRDRAGIAHVYAETPHDLFMAQGYVHAQDRMWQMEVWRHISSGRLSELFGRSQLDTDRFIRTLGWRRAAARDLAALSPEARAALDAYAEGVNAWLDRHRGGLGMGFVVTGFRTGTGGLGGYDPEPWTALDSVAWQKVQSWNLGGNLDVEIFRMLADARLGDPARTDELFAGYASTMPTIIPRSGSAAAEPPPTAEQPVPGLDLTPESAAAWHQLALLASAPQRVAGLDGGDELVGDHGLGSNNWVVAPSLSASGGALLANDPHLGIGMPSVWYMNGLHCREVSSECPFDVAGVSFPGTPAVVLGHNARIAWGATNVDPDVQDLFLVVEDPDDPDCYRYLGECREYATRTEEVPISGGETETLTIRETALGVILNDVDERLGDAPLLALRWAATTDVDGTFEAIFRVNTASNFEEFRAALRNYGTPSQNFVYADVDGHIGYQLPGRIPVRSGGARGLRPAPGDGSADWTGWIPFDQLPTAYDPPEGWIVTANNAPLDPTTAPFLGASSEWDPGYRAARIIELLGEASNGAGVALDDLVAIQMDDDLPRARIVIPNLSGAAPATDDGRAVLDAIRGWDYRCTVDSRGCAAYMAFELRLIGGIWDDELGPLARDWVGGGASWQALVGLLGRPDSAWWDDRATTTVRETPAQIIGDALDRVGAELREAVGPPDQWRWGAIHKATFREETLGASGIGVLEAYFNRGPLEVAGAAGAVQNNAWRASRAYANPYDPEFDPLGIDRVFGVAVLPSYRLAIDLADLDGARIVQTTGQSGNPFDGHYGDLIAAWQAGETIGLPFSESRVEAAQSTQLVLTPP
jgi:penicillin amidase